MARHYHVVMSRGGFTNDYFSSAYRTEEEAEVALQNYVDTDLEDRTVVWEWAEHRYVDPDSEATVEIRSCDRKCDRYGV
jgi:hypothetical protein